MSDAGERRCSTCVWWGTPEEIAHDDDLRTCCWPKPFWMEFWQSYRDNILSRGCKTWGPVLSCDRPPPRRHARRAATTHRVERIGDAELWLGDCREIAPTLGPVDFIFTDPPYGHNNNNNDLIHRREAALGQLPAGVTMPGRAIANDGAVASDLARWLFAFARTAAQLRLVLLPLLLRRRRPRSAIRALVVAYGRTSGLQTDGRLGQRPHRHGLALSPVLRNGLGGARSRCAACRWWRFTPLKGWKTSFALERSTFARYYH